MIWLGFGNRDVLNLSQQKMPKPGPKPKPTNFKKLTGNPGKRALPKDEPRPKRADKLPSAPRHLDRVAKKEWRRIGSILHAAGVLTDADLTALAAYCATYSLWIDAQMQIQKHGVLIKAQSGFPMQSPYLQISNKAMGEMRKWLVEFGGTPSSRARVAVEKPKKEKDPLAEFKERGGKLRTVK